MQDGSTTTVVKRGIVRGVLTLWRERQWMTALGALFGVFLLVQLLVLVLTGLEGAQTLLKNRTDLQLEILQEATDNDIQSFLVGLEDLTFVKSTVYITKEKIFEQTRVSDPHLIAFLEEFKITNPFADNISITLGNLDHYDQLSSFIKQEQWNNVVNPAFLSKITDQEKQVHALLSITTAVRSLTILILLITAAALIFIVTELVRRRAMARSDEVLVERLVGATPLSITIPFITEAVILLFTAIILSTAVMLVVASLLPLYIPALSHNGILGPLRNEIAPLMTSLLPMLLLIEILMTPLLASIGAWLGVRPQVCSPRIANAL
jgi:cell division transport system permease protein